MERLCFLIELEPGTEQEYERRHDELWPEMHAALKAAGYRNYSLFRRGSTVIGYAECVPDVAAVLAAMDAAPVTPPWNESFQGIIRRITDDAGDLIRAAEVWHLD